MSASPYRLVILARDRDWARVLQERVTQALADVAGLPDAVEFTSALVDEPDPAAPRPHVVVALLADEASRDDAGIVEDLEAARRHLLPVLPLVHAGVDISATLPEVVQPLNAYVWDADESGAVRALLRLLGLIEEERRLFLSYRRYETSALALQLRTRFSERGYDVFLDRFSVPPAADFQHRINVELSDKAFVLLLESPAAVGSKWVQHEVAFAQSHNISLLALCLPETQRMDQFPEVDEAFRHRLTTSDLVPGGSGVPEDRELGDGALGVVLDEVETRYARQLRQRRVEMLGSVALWLDQANAPAEATADEWGLAADETIFLITPRAPAPRDLQRLDALRKAREAMSGRAAQGCLVFRSPVQDDADRALISWIVDGRPLETVLLERIPSYLGLP